MELRIVKVINQDSLYKDKNGKEHLRTNYYLVINGQYLAFRPSFADGYRKLDLVAEIVKNGK